MRLIAPTHVNSESALQFLNVIQTGSWFNTDPWIEIIMLKGHNLTSSHKCQQCRHDKQKWYDLGTSAAGP